MEKLQFEKATMSENVSRIMTQNRKPILFALIALVAFLFIFGITAIVGNALSEKGIAAVDAIEYEFFDNSSALSDSEKTERETKALSALEPYAKKFGITGARANMLIAEIYFFQKKYAEAKSAWEAVYKKSHSSYLAPLSLFNLAACEEELNDAKSARTHYENASGYKNFSLASHALFSSARLYESDNIAKAKELYQKIVDSYTDDAWARLAKTRLLSLTEK